MTAWVQNEKLKAKSRAKTPAMTAQARSWTLPPLHAGIIQRSMLEASKATNPTAKAPQSPLNKLISHAALPRGNNWKSHANRVHKG